LEVRDLAQVQADSSPYWEQFSLTAPTLTELILPVGGINEKILAAKRSGIHPSAVPAENEVNVKEDLKTEQLGDLKIHVARTWKNSQ
jgi:ATP-dependent Lon protease